MNFRNISKHLEFSQHFFENFPFWSQSLKNLNFSHNSWKKIMLQYPKDLDISFWKIFLKSRFYLEKLILQS